MVMIKRYDVGYDDDIGEECNGRFVKYSDYKVQDVAALKQELIEANATMLSMCLTIAKLVDYFNIQDGPIAEEIIKRFEQVKNEK